MTTAHSLEALARLITRSAALGRAIHPLLDGPAPSEALRSRLMELAGLCDRVQDRNVDDEGDDLDDRYEAAFGAALRWQAEQRAVEAQVLDLLQAMTEDAVVSGRLVAPHQHLEITITVHDRPRKARVAVLR